MECDVRRILSLENAGRRNYGRRLDSTSQRWVSSGFGLPEEAASQVVAFGMTLYAVTAKEMYVSLDSGGK